jgi:hypothetical protein
MGFFKKLFGSSDEPTPKKEEVSNPKVTLPFEIKVTTSFSSSSSQEEKLKPIVPDNTGSWIINPETPFVLTVLTKDKNLAQQIRDIVDEDNNDYKKDEKLAALLAEHNIKIKEIEEYKTKYQKVYLSKIEQLKNSSSEWASLGEKDREDLMIDFRKLAIKEIYEIPSYCNLEVLFENEPQDISFDDELIKEYGFKNMQTYIKHADKLDKVRTIANDNYARATFEKLVELNLAVRGSNIPKEDILSSLSLKDLNSIAQPSEKEFKRKNQAIDHIMTLDGIDERIGKQISLRELFQLKPLPNKYKSIDIKAISDTWNYHHEEANLLLDTFRNSYYSWRNLKDREYVKEYTVQSHKTEEMCPCAKDLIQKKYPKNSPPKIPCHIGCDCYINQVHNFD